MFTGIVETTGRVCDIERGSSARRLAIQADGFGQELPTGASVGVSGVCLTIVERRGGAICFNVVPETLRRSTLGDLSIGDRVNLERSLRAGDRIDGHFVQGHVDGVAEVTDRFTGAGDHVVWLRPDAPLLEVICPKGSVALDGVSLTVAEMKPDRFSVALIPMTIERTTLGGLRIGSRVNVETDMIARTVVHYLSRFGSADKRSSLTLERLTAYGFA